MLAEFGSYSLSRLSRPFLADRIYTSIIIIRVCLNTVFESVSLRLFYDSVTVQVGHYCLPLNLNVNAVRVNCVQDCFLVTLRGRSSANSFERDDVECQTVY